MKTTRLQKLIAATGMGSRRKAETWIQAGRVSVNRDTVTKMGTLIDPDKDQIKIDGVPISLIPLTRKIYALYKPKSCITSMSDPEGRDTIVTYLPKSEIGLSPLAVWTMTLKDSFWLQITAK